MKKAIVSVSRNVALVLGVIYIALFVVSLRVKGGRK
jgi:hypothetical protein